MLSRPRLLPTKNETHRVREIRFRDRISQLRGFGTWTHYPSKGLWQETVPGVCPGKWNPLGRPIFVMSLAVYDREIFNMSVGEWARFLEWHPPTVRKFHSHFNEADPDGGLVDAGHFAIHRENVVG